MAHPPNRISNLSMRHFFELIVQEQAASKADDNTKVIKLDFKEWETLEPTLEEISRRWQNSECKLTIIINADILPGPGHDRRAASNIAADAFI